MPPWNIKRTRESRHVNYGMKRMPEKVVDGRDKPGHDEENDAF
jgi:hypothetical protein